VTRQQPAGDLALWLRRATGVDEKILDGIATERGRYTAMGGVVVGTGLIAMFSMAVALSFVFGRFPPFAAVFVLLWGAFVFSLDRWLMASAAGVRAVERLVRLVPRLILACAVGVVVAEPLVLVAFDATIVETATKERKDELLTLESDLLVCNPVPGTTPAPGGPRCAGRKLALANTSPEGKQAEITGLQGQITTLSATVQRDSDAAAKLEAEARKECNGTDGPGLSGKFGVGPSCRRLRQTTDDYRKVHRIEENVAELANLNAQIEKLNGTTGEDADAFVQARKDAIAREKEAVVSRQRELGLLERMRVLGHITEDNGYALAGEWALRIFLVLIDALPVLVKLLGGFTTYDAIVADRLKRQKVSQFEVNRAVAARDSYGARLWSESYLEQLHAGRERIRWRGMRERRALKATMYAEVEKRTQEIIGEGPTLRLKLTAEVPEATVEEPAPPPAAPPGQRDWRDFEDPYEPERMGWTDR
jgi:hypothetical protein